MPSPHTYFLSHNQKDFWFLSQSAPESAAFNDALTARIRAPVDVPALQRACRTLAARHSVLRTTFPILNGEPVQAVHDDPKVCFEVTDAQAWTWDEMRQHVSAAYARPLDLEHGPVWRVDLFTRTAHDHILLVTMHEIICDAWSCGVILTELDVLYAAEVQDTPSPPLPSATPYTDYAHWQHDMLAGEKGERLRTYWRRQLSDVLGESEGLALPTDRPLPPVRTYRGASQSFHVRPDVLAQLETLAKAEGATLFAVLLAAYQVLLSRYTGQTLIPIGVPMSGRSRREFHNTLGNLMNPVVVHGDMSDSPLFTDFLAQVQRAVRGALLHQEYPFSLLIKQFQPQQDFNYAPIAQVFFNMPLSPRFTEFAPLFLPEQRREKVPWGGMELESFYIPQQEGQFLLGFDVWKMDDTLLVTAKYNTDVFDAETIMRMGGHYQTLLEGIVTHPRESISHLPLLTEAERQQVLVQWNRTESAGLATACFHHLFEAQVERTPEAEAVVSPDDGRRLTYRELNRRANQLAHYLKPLGAGSDVLIGICMERSVDMVVALLGVLKAGAAYVPLDPSYPSTRLAFMLEDAEVPILLTQEKLVATLPGHLARVICIDKNWDRMAQESEHNLVNDVVPEDLAYCIFTSGSTGRSKGVLITHGSFVNAHLAWAEAYRLRDACTSVLQMANFAWDVFSGDLARTLLHGAKLVLCPREWLLAPEALYHLMREEQVDCAEFVPVLLRNLVQHLEQTGQDLSFMRLLIAGSDSWYMEEYHKFQQFCGAHTRLINSYGITEATIDSSYFEGTDTLVSRDGGVPIGRPFANTQLYILDPHLQPVPIGGIGELHVGGANIARGYLNRPELTKEKFIPNPFGPTDRPGRLYKTGDKARYLRDGNIEFLGRIDDQLKIRGFRVEPGEIEAALSQHAKVSATVVATQEGPSGKRLVAYVVPEADPVDTGDLLAHLKDTLPAHMIPAAIVVLESLPLTPNGKVDRRALPAPDTSDFASSTDFVRPETPIEKILAAVWEEVLGLERVGTRNNFFEIGGDSILGIQIISRARHQGVTLTVPQLFQYQTIAELAGVADITDVQDSLTPSAPDVTSEPGDAEQSIAYCLAPIQREMLRHTLSLPESDAYLIQLSCTLHGPLDVAAFKQAWQQVVDRHPALRTEFEWSDAEPLQRVQPSATLPWQEHDWQSLTPHEQNEHLKTFLEEDRARGHTLDRAPLMRCALMTCAPERRQFVLSLHHLLTDGWSQTIILQDVLALYRAACQDQPVELARPRPYGDYITWLQQQDMAAPQAFWRQALRSLPPPSLLSKDRSTEQSIRYEESHLRVSARLSADLQAMVQQHRLTLNTLVQGAWAVLLSRYSGDLDVVFGVTVSGRPPALTGMESMVGPFINNLPVQVRVPDEAMLLPWLQQLMRQQVEMEQYGYISLDLIRQWREVAQEQPLFESNVRFQNYPIDAQLLQQWGSRLAIDDIRIVDWWHYPLNLIVVPQTNLSLSITYDCRSFDSKTIAQLLEDLQTLLAAVATAPQQRLETLRGAIAQPE